MLKECDFCYEKAITIYVDEEGVELDLCENHYANRNQINEGDFDE
jgi:hypothetical protein